MNCRRTARRRWTWSCSQAYRLGLEEVAFTDHYELIEGVTARGSIRREYLEISREKLLACRSRWEGRIRVVFGIELGQCHKQPEAASQILASNPYDFVLASLHRAVPMTPAWCTCSTCTRMPL